MANGRQAGTLEGLLWLAQRLSALLLVAGLGLHLAVIHLLPGAGSAFREVSVRLAQPGWRVFEAAFLVVATSHALGGLWTIACDYVTSPGVRRLLLLLLAALGAEILGVGLYTLASLPWAG
jgi:succinate dehydrogenase hydrophobic membrane anchor protein